MIDIDYNRKHIALGVLGLFLIGGYLAVGGAIGVINDATRADLSQHVSNKPCGLQPGFHSSDAMCPGEMQCFSGLVKTGFDEDRVGANISGSRCVTPIYEERYCGIFEANILAQSDPPSMGECQPYTDWHSIGLTDYIDAITETDLYDRIFNTDQNGTAIIQQHGLKLATEDPNAEQFEVSCSDKRFPNFEEHITPHHYMGERVDVTVDNETPLQFRLERLGNRSDEYYFSVNITVFFFEESRMEREYDGRIPYGWFFDYDNHTAVHPYSERVCTGTPNATNTFSCRIDQPRTVGEQYRIVWYVQDTECSDTAGYSKQRILSVTNATENME